MSTSVLENNKKVTVQKRVLGIHKTQNGVQFKVQGYTTILEFRVQGLGLRRNFRVKGLKLSLTLNPKMIIIILQSNEIRLKG